MRCLDLVSANTTEVSVAAYGIVEPVDVVGYVLGRRVPTGVDALLDPLLFQTTEESMCKILFSSKPVHTIICTRPFPQPHFSITRRLAATGRRARR